MRRGEKTGAIPCPQVQNTAMTPARLPPHPSPAALVTAAVVIDDARNQLLEETPAVARVRKGADHFKFREPRRIRSGN